MDRFILLCAGLVVLSYSLSHFYRVVALALHIVDTPNHRSAHKAVTPTGAGIVFVSLYCLGLLLSSFSGELPARDIIFLQLLFPLLLIALVGLIDDYSELRWSARAFVHLSASAWALWLIGFPELIVGSLIVDLGLTGLVFGTFALAWLTNLYNFMDGIDGIAAGEALFVVLSASAISIFVSGQSPSVPALILMAVLLGFLVINWPKAKVFMGDTGSGFLGFLLGVFMLAEFLVSIWSWLILLCWFLTDACLTIVVRWIRGERIIEAHALHAYQHLNRAVGTGYTLAVILGFNVVWLLPLAVLAHRYPEFGFGLLTLAAAPLLMFQFYCGAGQLSPRAIRA